MKWLALFLLGVSFSGMAVASESLPRFEWTECPFKQETPLADVDCGYLTVLENREHPNGRTLRLAVAVLRSHSETPAPDPLVFLAGGPGEAAVKYVPRRVDTIFWNRLRQTRDIIFFDQRGTGFSDPEFCPEVSRALYSGSFQGMEPQALTAMQVKAVKECRQEMLAKGLDFSAYNSATSARDLDDLRRVLGYERWNLFGISYGARLALTAMRDTPTGIRSAVLDSTPPPNIHFWVDNPARFSRSLQLVFDQCAAQESCRRAFPTLEQDFYAVLDQLERQPVVLQMPDETRFPQGRIVIDGTLLAAGVFQGLYDPRFIQVLPLLIRELKAGHTEVLKAIAEGLVLEPRTLDMGLMYAINCYEVSPFNPPARVAEEQARYPELSVWYEFVNESAICAAWHQQRAGPLEQQPVVSEIPALVLAGEFDPVTAPAYGRLAAETLPNSIYIETRGLGHGVAFFSDCTRSLMTAFLEQPNQPLDTRCLDELEPMRFITDVHVEPGIYRLTASVRDGSPWLLGGLGSLMVILLSAVPGWPVAALIRRRRGESIAAVSSLRQARWLAGTAALLGLVFLGGLAGVIAFTVSMNPYILAFGVPGWAAPLFMLPWGLGLLSIGILPWLVGLWYNKQGTVIARLHISLVALACLGCVAIAAYWGVGAWLR